MPPAHVSTLNAKYLMRPDASIELVIYPSERKTTIISIGEILLSPIIPSYTSCRPIAKMASKKRSAIKGAVIKLMGKLSRTKSLTWQFWLSLEPWWEWSCFGDMTRKVPKVYKTASESGLGTYTGIRNGQSTMISREGERVSFMEHDKPWSPLLTG